MKKFTIIALILAALSAAVFLFNLNDIIISIRLNELKTNLQDIDENERNIDHIGLIATYDLNKRIYENGISQEKFDALEQKIASLVIHEKNHPEQLKMQNGFLSRFAIKVINFNRKVIGKRPLIINGEPEPSAAVLDAAYYYERNYMFGKAIVLYEKVLADKKIRNTLRASVLLHQGYCYALSGFNAAAKKNYFEIADRFPQENSSITAAILLRYLEGFQIERDRVLLRSGDPVSVSRNLVNLLGYKEAFQILQKAEVKAGSKDVPKINYYMARCLAGLGNPEKAAEKYIEIITSSPSSPYAMFSNRKLFLIGVQKMDPKIVGLSSTLNEKLKDPVLSQMVKDQNVSENTMSDSIEMTEIKLPKKTIKNIDLFIRKKETAFGTNAKLEIVTSDGNTLKGTLLKQNDTVITIQTSIGRIDVKKDTIVSMKILDK